MEVRFERAGRMAGRSIMRLKPICQYIFYFVMISYEIYDCVSDGMNVYQYSQGDSVDVSARNDGVYYAFLFSLIISIMCAISGSMGYTLLIVGLSKKLHHHQSAKNKATKFGKLIIFVSLFCQVSFEESVQSVVLYQYIVRCSVLYSFWKMSLFVCISLSLLFAGYTFLKIAHLWFKKQALLPSKYPACLAPCYDSKALHFVCIALCLFGLLLSLGLFALNITTLVDIVKKSEVSIPHILASSSQTSLPPFKISSVRELVEAKGPLVKTLPCMMPKSKNISSHFLLEHASQNCSTVIFTLSLAKNTKQLRYNLHYCYKNNKCDVIKLTNITLKFSHQLCSRNSPILVFLGDPRPSTKQNRTAKEN